MKKFNSPIVYLKFTVPKPTWQHIEEKINWFKPLKFYKINIKFKKKGSKQESSRFEKPRCKLGFKEGFNSRTQFASNESNLIPKNLEHGRHLKWA
jgi:hypothetical protein